MVAIAEDWQGLALGQDVEESPLWDRFGFAANGVIKVSALGFADGIRAALINGTTGSSGFYTSWVNQSQVYADWYWSAKYDTAATGQVYIARVSPAVDGSAGAELRVNGGKFQIRNGTSSAAVSVADAVLDDRLYRLRWRVNMATSTQTFDVFAGTNAHGTVPTESISGPYTQGNVGRIAFGPVANTTPTVTSQRFMLVNVRDSSFGAPWVGGGKLDTPVGVVFNRAVGIRQIGASCPAVEGAASYTLEVQYLSGTDPTQSGDWTLFDTFDSPTPSWTLTATDGIQWGETYRGRVIAKVA